MTWIAHYTDGTYLPQVDKEREWQFKNIRQEDLEKFELVLKNKSFIVDLNKGEVYLNGIKLGFPESGSGTHRLIYFRRVRQKIATGNPTDNVEVDEYFGFQTTIQGNNIKRVFAYKSNGTLIQE